VVIKTALLSWKRSWECDDDEITISSSYSHTLALTFFSETSIHEWRCFDKSPYIELSLEELKACELFRLHRIGCNLAAVGITVSVILIILCIMSSSGQVEALENPDLTRLVFADGNWYQNKTESCVVICCRRQRRNNNCNLSTVNFILTVPYNCILITLSTRSASIYLH